MSKPADENFDKEYIKDIHFLYEIISSLRGKQEIKQFLKDMLTSAELRMFRRRWHIACDLEKGMTFRDLAKKNNCGTNTIMRIAEKIKSGAGGLSLALERTRKDRSPRKRLVEGLSAKFGSYAYYKRE